MSRAFTRETDDAPERPVAPRPAPPLPPGAVNYLTANGEQRLRTELKRLLEMERPRLAAPPVNPESQRQLQTLDQRIHYLQQSLHSAVVVPPPTGPEDRVRFGATVTVRDHEGECDYRIVGVDETDPSQGWVSWLSPIARALQNTRRGDRVRLQGPGGERELEIVRVRYE